MKYAKFDLNGFPQTFCSEDVHGPFSIPTYGPVPEPTATNPHPMAPIIGNTPNPAYPSGCVAITDDQWMDFISNPGMRQWNGTSVVTYVAPPPGLSTVQANKIASLSASCATQITAGYTSSALGSAHTYPSKPTDQSNMTASVVASLIPNLPSTWTTQFWCQDSTGTWAMVAHTATQIQQAGQDGKAAILAAQVKNSNLAAQVMAATTVAAVNAINW